MTENDPMSTLERNQREQLLKRLTLWKQEDDAQTTPEEDLRLEKEKWAEKKRRARDDARRCVLEGPEALARFDKAADRESYCVSKLAGLQDRDGPQARRLKEANRQRRVRVKQKYGVPLHRIEEYLRVPSPSPPPGFTNRSAGRGRIPSPSETASDEPISPPPSGTFPPVASGNGNDQDGGSSPEIDRCGRGPEHPSAAMARISANGESIATDDVRPTASGSRAANNKRRAGDSSFMCTLSLPSKRQRQNEAGADATITAIQDNSDQGDDDEVESDREPDSDFSSQSGSEPSPTPEDDQVELPRYASQRSIDFDDLYEDGNARYKHHIALHNGVFYVLRCDSCGLHFGDHPLMGAGRHLDSRGHGYMSRVRDTSVAVLGIEVLNCDGGRQALNNTAFRTALGNGYRVHRTRYYTRNPDPQPQQQATAATAAGTTSTTVTTAITTAMTTTATTGTTSDGNITNTRRRNPRTADEAVLSPVPGRIYIAYWNGPTQVGVIVLPRADCFGDPSFGEVGLSGSSLAADTDLMADVPECYCTSSEPKQITGWREGYEDGGEAVRGRKYPVMYFDGVEGFRKGSVMWISVTDLREYDCEDYVSNGGLIENYGHLRRFEKERERAGEEGVEEQPGGDAAAEDRRSETSEPELPDYTPPRSPPQQPTEAVEPSPDTVEPSPDTFEPSPGAVTPPPDTVATGGVGRAPSDPPDHPIHVAGEHRDGEVDSAAPDPRQLGRWMKPQTTNAFPIGANIRPTPENVVGHVTTTALRFSPHHVADQAVGDAGRRPERLIPEVAHSAASASISHSRGPYDSLGSENAALMSHTSHYETHAAYTASMQATGSEAAPSLLPPLRNTASAATMDSPGRRLGATTGHPPVGQGPASGQAGPSTRVDPVPPRIRTALPYPPREGDTRGSAIVIDDKGPPPPRASPGSFKWTPRRSSPFKRSFDHTPAAPRDTEPVPVPQFSAAGTGGQGLGRQEPDWMTVPWGSMHTAPEAVMASTLDGSDIDFEPYIYESHGM